VTLRIRFMYADSYQGHHADFSKWRFAYRVETTWLSSVNMWSSRRFLTVVLILAAGLSLLVNQGINQATATNPSAPAYFANPFAGFASADQVTSSITTTSTTIFTTAPISISVNPSYASAGASVQVSGSGFSLSDSSCSLSSVAVESPYCSVSDGTLSGSFEVANVATGYYTITAIGSTGDSASTSFAVAPSTAPAVPGFPIEAILLGLILGLVIVAIFRRRLMNRSTTTE